MKAKPAYYREQAKRSRDLAQRVLSYEIKDQLLRVAEEYDKLADEAQLSS